MALNKRLSLSGSGGCHPGARAASARYTYRSKQKADSRELESALLDLAEWTGLEPATPGVTEEYPRTTANNGGQIAY